MLTNRQRDALDFLRAHQQQHGCSPTFRQIADHLQISSKSGVHRLLEGLQQRGFIKRRRGLQQAIEIIAGDPVDNLPTADLIAALRRRGVGPEALV